MKDMTKIKQLNSQQINELLHIEIGKGSISVDEKDINNFLKLPNNKKIAKIKNLSKEKFIKVENTADQILKKYDEVENKLDENNIDEILNFYLQHNIPAEEKEKIKKLKSVKEKKNYLKSIKVDIYNYLVNYLENIKQEQLNIDRNKEYIINTFSVDEIKELYMQKIIKPLKLSGNEADIKMNEISVDNMVDELANLDKKELENTNLDIQTNKNNIVKKVGLVLGRGIKKVSKSLGFRALGLLGIITELLAVVLDKNIVITTSVVALLLALTGVLPIATATVFIAAIIGLKGLATIPSTKLFSGIINNLGKKKKKTTKPNIFKRMLGKVFGKNKIKNNATTEENEKTQENTKTSEKVDNSKYKSVENPLKAAKKQAEEEKQNAKKNAKSNTKETIKELKGLKEEKKSKNKNKKTKISKSDIGKKKQKAVNSAKKVIIENSIESTTKAIKDLKEERDNLIKIAKEAKGNGILDKSKFTEKSEELSKQIEYNKNLKKAVILVGHPIYTEDTLENATKQMTKKANDKGRK